MDNNSVNKDLIQWSLSMSFPGDDSEPITARYLWKEEFSRDGETSIGHWGYLVDPTTNEDLNLDETVAKPFKSAASAFRVSQLRSELNVREIGNLFESRDKIVAEKILELFERNQRGEYLGQYSNNDLFYVQDVAKILDLDLKETIQAVNRLVFEGKLGLNGMILIPHEDYEEGFKYWEKATGHKRLSMSDFGYWGCSACSKHGDEYEKPSDFPCKPPVK